MALSKPRISAHRERYARKSGWRCSDSLAVEYGATPSAAYHRWAIRREAQIRYQLVCEKAAQEEQAERAARIGAEGMECYRMISEDPQAWELACQKMAAVE
jgi:hypothetical protein